MRFGSVCSGIGATESAWRPLGWECVFMAEIEPFPCAVLEHHYPNTPNYGDMTKHAEWPIGRGAIDVLVGGTPCQSFSVAGLRKGMDDPRGNLALVYLAIIDRLRPHWIVWENVPGVLSSNEGRDFGAFLGGLAKLGYCCAFRIMDAQHYGVAQRRRRVFVVGHLGTAWQRAAAVLFDRACLRWDSAPRRETGQDPAPTLDARSGRSGANEFATSGGVVPALTGSGRGVARVGESRGQDPVIPVCCIAEGGPVSLTACNASKTVNNQTALVTHTLCGEGHDASEDGTGRGTPLVAVPQSVALRGRDGGATAELSGNVATALRASQGGGDKPHALTQYGVRRLTPRECERLQGFPDDWTLVSYRGKPAADTPRYRAIGNAMAVPVMRWIGERIQQAEEIE